MAQPEAFTVDAFHRGRFHLVQPAAKGHRAGLDAMLLSAAVPSGFAGRVADLGAGAGAAGFAVAARCAGTSVRLVELAEEMVDCARKSLALPENEALAPRIEVLHADVELSGRARTEGGLADRCVDFAIMNPPFNAAPDRASPDLLRQQAHVMAPGLLERWVRTAAAIVSSGGGLAAIARPASLAELLQALEGRFGAPEILPVHARDNAEAIRVLIRGRKGARGKLRLLPGLVLHGPDNAFTGEAEAVINGQATLFDD